MPGPLALSSGWKQFFQKQVGPRVQERTFCIVRCLSAISSMTV